MNEPEEEAQIPTEIESNIIPSVSVLLSDSVPLDTSSQDPQQCKSKRVIILRHHFEIERKAFMCTPQDEDEPKSYKEVLSSLAFEKWKATMIKEMESMKKNQVWDLVDIPPRRKTIGNKWVLKVKCKADRSIERYKAQLMAKGYTQMEGVDYEKTFSLVVRFASIHLILAIVAHLDLKLHQTDVKTAFFNGELDEEIYMD